LGEKHHWRKFALWENVLRSVLMIKVPKGAPGLPRGSKDGTPCHRIVSLQDIYPTLVEACGLKARNDIDGNSLAPLLEDPEARWNRPAVATYDFGEFSIRTERFRYSTYIDGSEELYDHVGDPEEWTNLADDPKYEAVKRRIRRHIPKSPAPLAPTSMKLMPHHCPPFRSKEEYFDWLNNGKDYGYLIEKYWPH
jgi:arylsulfatase A-like enzyme